jgi:hypothetical protein
VSTPITWEEVEQALKKKDANRLVFEAKDVLARVKKMGDLFGPVQKLKQKLPDLAGLGAAPEKEQEEQKREEEKGDKKRITAAAQVENRPSSRKKATSKKGKPAPPKRRKL